MLVLSRKKNECIIINDDIAIMVVEIRGEDKVRLGFELDKDLYIHRKEVWQAFREAHSEDFTPNQTVMLTPKSQLAVKILAEGIVNGSKNPTELLEQILVKAAEAKEIIDGSPW